MPSGRPRLISWWPTDWPGEAHDKVADWLPRQRGAVSQYIDDGSAGGKITPRIDPQRHRERFVATIAGVTCPWLVRSGSIEFARTHDALRRTMRRAALD
jgi:hypothetical protein